MSVHVTSWVLKHSDERLGRRLVLLVLADYANDEGGSCYPAVESIARDARLSKRQTQRCLQELTDSGAIEVIGTRDKGMNEYRVVMSLDNMSPPPNVGNVTPGVTNPVENMSEMSPDPPGPTKDPPEDSATPSARNVIWDTLVEFFGSPSTPGERSDFGKTVKEIRIALAADDPYPASHAALTGSTWLPATWDEFAEREIRRRVESVDEQYRSHRSLRNRWTELGLKAEPADDADLPDAADPDPDDEPCLYCEDGTGLMPDGSPCLDCGGTGKGSY